MRKGLSVKKRCFIFRSFCPTIPKMDLRKGKITDGMDFKGIAEQLCEKGLVREKTLFYIQELLSNYSEDGFTEGEYILSTAMTPDEMMDIMGADGEEK